MNHAIDFIRATPLVVLLLLTACGNDTKTYTMDRSSEAPTAAIQPAAATSAPPRPSVVPTTAPAPRAIGQPVLLGSDREGTRYTITVNAVRDPAQGTNQFNKPDGRHVLVDWSITNEGNKNVEVSVLSLKLLTDDNFEIERGNFAGFSGPELPSFPTLGPGQTVRGFRVYDVPRGAILKAAIYHPSGSPQFIIANLP